MAFSIIDKILSKKFLSLTLNPISVQVRNRNRYFFHRMKKQYPSLHINSHRVVHEDFITPDNREFLKEYAAEHNKQLLLASEARLKNISPLASAEPEVERVWTPYSKRTGLIVRKLGSYPMWDKNGKRFLAALLQVVDNHVVKYTPADEYTPVRPRIIKPKRKLGCLLVGAETVDPSSVTKEYYGLFAKHGVPPKKYLHRFFVTEDAKLPPGTPLLATHFRVGDHLDVLGMTINHGFQGVMKRWGFKGMPATHGVTKTHRRPGNIGGGGEKGRVWPGKKMPGIMGGRWRTLRGVEIVRINTVHNVLWVRAFNLPGGVGSLCYIHDSLLSLKKHTVAPPFPTSYGDEDLPQDILHKNVRAFDDPTVEFEE